MMRNVGFLPERAAVLGFPQTGQTQRLSFNAANVYYVNVGHANADDDNDGTDPTYPLETIQAAVDAAVAGDVIYIAPGEYDEAVTIAAAKSNLTLIGAGGRGAAYIAPSATNATALTVHAEDVTIVNVGCEGDGTGRGATVTGRRFRAQGCKFEGGAEALRIGPGTVAQEAAGTHGDAADGLLEDCEFAWSDVGLMIAASDFGAVTQLAVRRCKFHNLPDAAVTEVGAGGGVTASIQFRNLEIADCVFDDEEDGTAPTAFILLNDDNTNTGLVARCAFPTAINSGDNLVSTALHWVSNYHTGGVSAAQPS